MIEGREGLTLAYTADEDDGGICHSHGDVRFFGGCSGLVLLEEDGCRVEEAMLSATTEPFKGLRMVVKLCICHSSGELADPAVCLPSLSPIMMPQHDDGVDGQDTMRRAGRRAGPLVRLHSA